MGILDYRGDGVERSQFIAPSVQCSSWLLEAMEILTQKKQLDKGHIISYSGQISYTLDQRVDIKVAEHLEDVRCHIVIISSVWKVLVYGHSLFLSSKIV